MVAVCCRSRMALGCMVASLREVSCGEPLQQPTANHLGSELFIGPPRGLVAASPERRTVFAVPARQRVAAHD